MPSVYLILFSILGWGVGSVFYKLANNNIHPMMVTTIVTSVYVLLTPLAFFFVKFDHTTNTPGIMYSVGGALCMCVGSLAYFYALKAGGSAGETATLTALYPALTLLLSYLFLGEQLSIKKGIGMALALISIFFLTQK
jgi:bacterial/archaeal transporter family protein